MRLCTGKAHHSCVSGTEASFGMDDLFVNGVLDGFMDLMDLLRLEKLRSRKKNRRVMSAAACPRGRSLPLRILPKRSTEVVGWRSCGVQLVLIGHRHHGEGKSHPQDPDSASSTSQLHRRLDADLRTNDVPGPRHRSKVLRLRMLLSFLSVSSLGFALDFGGHDKVCMSLSRSMNPSRRGLRLS